VLLRKFQKRKTERTELDDILDNLNRILNTKKGFGSYVEQFGVGDWSAWKARQAIIDSIIAEIKENVKLYEARVRIDEIEEVKADSPFRIRFHVRCVYMDGSRPVYIILDSRSNKVYVEE
jgi:type VI secretion system protein